MDSIPIKQRRGACGYWRKFFWHPQSLIPSLAAFRPEKSAAGGSLVDLTLRVGPEVQPGHSLVVANLPGGKVIGDTIMVATAADEVFWGMQGLTVNPLQEDHWMLHRRRFRMPRRVRGTALLLSMNGENYYHWCMDSLPRWRLLREAGWDAGRADHVVLSNAAPAYQEQMLPVLGVPREKWLRCSKWEVLQFDRLIVPSMPVSISGLTMPWMRDFLRTTFMPSETPTPARKIYISRRSSSRRRLVNEEELENQLEKLGFQIIRLETMPVDEQVKLFSSARWIVGAHGAGLTNIVFSSPGAALFEIFHPEQLREHYAGLATLCGIAYRRIVGQNASPHSGLDDRDASFAVDIGEVIDTLAAAGLRAPSRLQ
jgi:hypothetical protein